VWLARIAIAHPSAASLWTARNAEGSEVESDKKRRRAGLSRHQERSFREVALSFAKPGQGHAHSFDVDGRQSQRSGRYTWSKVSGA
jgi:hypothetical protein